MDTKPVVDIKPDPVGEQLSDVANNSSELDDGGTSTPKAPIAKKGELQAQ